MTIAEQSATPRIPGQESGADATNEDDQRVPPKATVVVRPKPYHYWTLDERLSIGLTESQAAVMLGTPSDAEARAYRDAPAAEPIEVEPRPASEWREADLVALGFTKRERGRFHLVRDPKPSHGAPVHTQDGLAMLLVHQAKSNLRYVIERERWIVWEGDRWAVQPAGGGKVREYARAIARSIDDSLTEYRTFKRHALSASGIAGVVALAQTDPRFAIHVDELDAPGRPWELNTPAGIVDLRTGTVVESDASRLHTRITACAPDFQADRGPWLDFLGTTFGGDAELIGFIHRLLGYACLGEVREQILPVFHGQGSNGKSVLVETVAAVLGDYSTGVAQRFLAQGPPQHPTEIAKLAGRRLVIATETNESETFDEARVKLLTGGDSLTARFMRADEFTFTPSHTLILVTNHLPDVRSGGHSLWRRIRQVPFLHEIADSQEDPGLRARLVAEHGPAVLAWLVDGAVEYARVGLNAPDSVRLATAEYRAATDTVARFAAEALELEVDDRERTSVILEAYRAWCAEEGETPVSPKAFGMRIARLPGIRRDRPGGVKFYAGLRLSLAWKTRGDRARSNDGVDAQEFLL